MNRKLMARPNIQNWLALGMSRQAISWDKKCCLKKNFKLDKWCCHVAVWPLLVPQQTNNGMGPSVLLILLFLIYKLLFCFDWSAPGPPRTPRWASVEPKIAAKNSRKKRGSTPTASRRERGGFNSMNLSCKFERIFRDRLTSIRPSAKYLGITQVVVAHVSLCFLFKRF